MEPARTQEKNCDPFLKTDPSSNGLSFDSELDLESMGPVDNSKDDSVKHDRYKHCNGVVGNGNAPSNVSNTMCNSDSITNGVLGKQNGQDSDKSIDKEPETRMETYLDPKTGEIKEREVKVVPEEEIPVVMDVGDLDDVDDPNNLEDVNSPTNPVTGLKSSTNSSIKAVVKPWKSKSNMQPIEVNSGSDSDSYDSDEYTDDDGSEETDEEDDRADPRRKLLSDKKYHDSDSESVTDSEESESESEESSEEEEVEYYDIMNHSKTSMDTMSNKEDSCDTNKMSQPGSNTKDKSENGREDSMQQSDSSSGTSSNTQTSQNASSIEKVPKDSAGGKNDSGTNVEKSENEGGVAKNDQDNRKRPGDNVETPVPAKQPVLEKDTKPIRDENMSEKQWSYEQCAAQDAESMRPFAGFLYTIAGEAVRKFVYKDIVHSKKKAGVEKEREYRQLETLEKSLEKLKQIVGSEGQKITCEMCPFTSVSTNVMAMHYEYAHVPEDDDSVYGCPICRKIEHTPFAYFDHLSNVHRRKGRIEPRKDFFECHNCAYQNSAKHGLKKHIIKCDQVFKYRTHLLPGVEDCDIPVKKLKNVSVAKASNFFPKKQSDKQKLRASGISRSGSNPVKVASQNKSKVPGRQSSLGRPPINKKSVTVREQLMQQKTPMSAAQAVSAVYAREQAIKAEKEKRALLKKNVTKKKTAFDMLVEKKTKELMQQADSQQQAIIQQMLAQAQAINSSKSKGTTSSSASGIPLPGATVQPTQSGGETLYKIGDQSYKFVLVNGQYVLTPVSQVNSKSAEKTSSSRRKRSDPKRALQEKETKFLTSNPRPTPSSKSMSSLKQINQSTQNKKKTTDISKFQVCEICQGVVKDLAALKIHFYWAHKINIDIVSQVNPYVPCMHCNRFFWTHVGMKKHIQEAHPSTRNSSHQSSPKSLRCPFCAKQVTDIMSHLAMSHGMTLEKIALQRWCPICGCSFATEILTKRHVLNTHAALLKQSLESMTAIKSKPSPVKSGIDAASIVSAALAKVDKNLPVPGIDNCKSSSNSKS